MKLIDPIVEAHRVIDARHEAATSSGFSSTLSDKDRARLRAIIKRVHLANYPTEMITNYEADKMIDVIAPETAAYLIRKNFEAVK